MCLFVLLRRLALSWLIFNSQLPSLSCCYPSSIFQSSCCSDLNDGLNALTMLQTGCAHILR